MRNSLLDNYRIEHFDCDCASMDHSIRLMFEPDEIDPRFSQAYIDACFPARHGFWERLKIAAKYVWDGSRGWTYGTYIIRDKDVPRLQAFFRDYEGYLWKLKQKQKAGGNESVEEDSV